MTKRERLARVTKLLGRSPSEHDIGSKVFDPEFGVAYVVSSTKPPTGADFTSLLARVTELEHAVSKQRSP